MSSKTHGQPISRLIMRQSSCMKAHREGSHPNVVKPIGRGKGGISANLYKNVLKNVLYQECSIEFAGEVFLMQ